jgi:preprotein translocase subunit YajC
MGQVKILLTLTLILIFFYLLIQIQKQKRDETRRAVSSLGPAVGNQTLTDKGAKEILNNSFPSAVTNEESG